MKAIEERLLPLLDACADYVLSWGRPAWYRDLPPGFNWRDGHGDFRRGDYAAGFKKFSRSLEHIDTSDFALPLLRQRGVQLGLFGGLGDSIMFLRFATMLHAQGVDVSILITAPKYEPLRGLLVQQPYVARVLDAPLPGVPLMRLKSVPYVLGIDLNTLPTQPSVSVDETLVVKYRELLAGDTNFKVGIQYQCGKEKGDVWENRRSIDISHFKALAMPGVSLYNLNHVTAGDSKGVPLIEVGEYRSVTDVAALIKNMDLVISVDTMVAHLAGALGAPVWTLLPHPCSSWKFYLDEKKIPWYPTMTLFRQSRTQDWDEVMGQVRGALETIASKRHD